MIALSFGPSPSNTPTAKTTRQTGLLFPEYSHSSRLGDRFIQPLYLVVDDNMDATLTADYMTDFGFGSGLEFRYLLNDSAPGLLYGNYITGSNGEPDRALVEWTHDGILPGDIRLVVDVEYASKRLASRTTPARSDSFLCAVIRKVNQAIHGFLDRTAQQQP